MKVLIYTPHWKIGGIEKLIVWLTTYFAEQWQGYAFVVLTEDTPNPVNQFELPANTKIYFRSFSPFTPQNERNLRTLIQKIDPDVIVTMGSSRAFYKIPRAIVNLQYPFILSEHNTDSRLVKLFHNNYDFLNAVRHTADLNHFLLAEYAGRFTNQSSVRVIPNPILPSSYRADVVASDLPYKTIIHVARYHLGQKQQDLLVKSFSLLAKKYPDWKLKFYGDDWSGGREKLQRLVRKLNLSDQVVLHDATDNVAEVLASAQIFAFPSAYEGFSLAAGEALAVGLPVVAFASCQGVSCFIAHDSNGVLVESHMKDEKAFAAGLESLMGDVEKRMKLSQGALASIEAYSFEKFIAGWKSLLDEAYTLKGKNKLLKCSPMEREYFKLIVSGLLFDKLAALEKKTTLKGRVYPHLVKVYKLAASLYAQLNNQLHNVYSSLSWRLTSPLRYLYGSSFPNVLQKLFLVFYSPFLGIMATKKYYRQFKDNPNNFFADTRHPVNKAFLKLLELLGPKVVRR